MFIKSTRFEQVCPLLLSLIVACQTVSLDSYVITQMVNM